MDHLVWVRLALNRKLLPLLPGLERQPGGGSRGGPGGKTGDKTGDADSPLWSSDSGLSPSTPWWWVEQATPGVVCVQLGRLGTHEVPSHACELKHWDAVIDVRPLSLHQYQGS
ncbi:unnamed protein product [Arctogadus glacialis]